MVSGVTAVNGVPTVAVVVPIVSGVTAVAGVPTFADVVHIFLSSLLLLASVVLMSSYQLFIEQYKLKCTYTFQYGEVFFHAAHMQKLSPYL